VSSRSTATAPRPFSGVRSATQAAHLVHPQRRELLAQLREPASAATLGRRLGIPRQRLGHHLRALERDGLIECVATQRRGNCEERLLRVTARAFVISPEVLGGIGTSREGVEDRFSAAAQLDAAARTIETVAALQAKADAEGKRLATLTIDTSVRFASAATRSDFTEELTRALTRLVAKYHDDAAPRGRTFRVVLCAHPAGPAVTAPTSDAPAQRP
jgi:DNA-binding transcriptional ArsR family regulator